METEKGTEKKKTRCHICLKTIIGSSYKFKAHLYQHKAVEPRFKCDICLREFFRSDEYNRHVKRHSDNPDEIYFCNDCGRDFVCKRSLMYHMKKIHDEDNPKNGVKTEYKCIACGVIYCEERSLKYHIRKNHYNLQETKSPCIKKGFNETWLEPVKETNVCVQMTKINNSVISIKKFGTIKVEDNKNIKHNNDKAKFKEYISSIFAKQDNSHYSKARCDYCNKEMLKKSLLPHIRERHLKIKRFNCVQCDRTFSRHYQLVDHDCNKPRRMKRLENKE